MNNEFIKIYKWAFICFVIILICSQDAVTQERKNQIFVGFTYTPSFPIGNFADKSISNENAGFAKYTIGIFDMFLDFEFLFKNNLGVSGTYISEDYIIEQDISKSHLGFTCITLGPTVSFSINKNMALDFKFLLGHVTSILTLEGSHNDSKYGDGLGMDVRSLFRYQIFKRWCLVAQFGYFSSKQNFDHIPGIRIRALNVGLGAGLKIK